MEIEDKPNGEKKVIVRSHVRRRILKVSMTKDWYRVRLHDADEMRARGYRLRNVEPSAARDLSASEREAIEQADGRVVIGIRGPRKRPTGVRTQSILLPRDQEGN
jgi:hypothetical protein